MRFSRDPQPGWIHVFCPVCDEKLGEKTTSELKAFHCDDCRTEFYFYPNRDKKPRAILDKHKTIDCGCGRCGR